MATFGLLLEKGMVQEPGAIKESIVGPRQISLKKGKVYQAQLAPKYKSLADASISASEVATSLNLQVDDLVLEPLLVSTGVWFLLVQVPNEEVLRSLQPDQSKIEAISERLNLVGYYVFTTATEAADASARMFAPNYGIPEESATGMAAGPLACYLYEHMNFKAATYMIHQGYLMQPASPSQIEVQLYLDDTKISGLQVGGPVVVVEQLAL
ncbi:hypothetical protein GCM10028895_13170 [Pontibacter rugosus]